MVYWCEFRAVSAAQMVCYWSFDGALLDLAAKGNDEDPGEMIGKETYRADR